MKRGGQVIYAGALGHQSHMLVKYFEVSDIFSVLISSCKMFRQIEIPYQCMFFFNYESIISDALQSISGIPKCKDGQNPATWMLDVSSAAVESQLDIDFAEIYEKSDLYRYAVLSNYSLQSRMSPFNVNSNLLSHSGAI